MSVPVVAIVGRPNVGKSALFNRLLGRRQSIVADRPGVTRDRIYAECEWTGRHFMLCDTGGMDPEDPDVLRQQVFDQAKRALEEADLLLFVVDGRHGLHPLDHDLADLLRRQPTPFLLVVNKAESDNVEADRYQFYELGLGDPVAVSAIHGTNTGDLLDEVVARIPDEAEGAAHEEVGLALVGRPNVGKSSLLNRILGEERSLVHHEAGTTRDTVDTLIEHDGHPIRLLDTAGLRRKAKVDDEVEYFSSLRAMGALKRAQVGVLVLEATEPISAQDKRIGGYIQEAQIASLIVVNKWDLLTPGRRRDPNTKRKFAESLAHELDFLAYSPVIYVSAKTGEETDDILGAALDVLEQWSRRVETGTLNQVIQEAVALRPPPSYKGRQLKILYVSQKRTRPPTFIFKVNSPRLIHFSYRRYLENCLRSAYGFVGSPIVMKFVK